MLQRTNSREIRTWLYDDIFYNVKYRAIYVPVEHRSHEESDGDLTGNLVQRGKYFCIEVVISFLIVFFKRS